MKLTETEKVALSLVLERILKEQGENPVKNAVSLKDFIKKYFNSEEKFAQKICVSKQRVNTMCKDGAYIIENQIYLPSKHRFTLE